MVGWRLAALNAVVVPLAREYRITLPESAPNLVTGAGIFTSETSSQWTAPSRGESCANLHAGGAGPVRVAVAVPERHRSRLWLGASGAARDANQHGELTTAWQAGLAPRRCRAEPTFRGI